MGLLLWLRAAFATVPSAEFQTAPGAIPSASAPSSQSIPTSATSTSAPSVSASSSQSVIGSTEEIWLEARDPWRRYFARMVDGLIWAFTLGILLVLVGIDTKRMNDIGLSLLCLALWVPVEAFLLATLGTTLGKWLLALKRVGSPSLFRLLLEGLFPRLSTTSLERC